MVELLLAALLAVPLSSLLPLRLLRLCLRCLLPLSLATLQ